MIAGNQCTMWDAGNGIGKPTFSLLVGGEKTSYLPQEEGIPVCSSRFQDMNVGCSPTGT